MNNELNSFEKRYSLSETVIGYLPKIFSEKEVELIKFGAETITAGSVALSNFIKTSHSRKNYASMLIKFAPDFIMLDKIKNEIFFVEVKASLTPLCMRTNRMQMKPIDGREPKITEIADMDRDAWNAYKNLYPNTIIIDACVYNPTVLACQFVDKIECLRCYKEYRVAYDCRDCPVEQGRTFAVARNDRSTGSQMPHMNFSLKSFEAFAPFFQNLGFSVNMSQLSELIESIKNYNVNFPSSFQQDVRTRVIEELRAEGCYWAK